MKLYGKIEKKSKHQEYNSRIWIIWFIVGIFFSCLFYKLTSKSNTLIHLAKPKKRIHISTHIMETKFPLSSISNEDEKSKYVMIQIVSTVLLGFMSSSLSSIIMKMVIPSHVITTGLFTKRMLHPKYISWFKRLSSHRHLGNNKFQNGFKKCWGSIVKKRKSVSTANDLSNMLDMKEEKDHS